MDGFTFYKSYYETLKKIRKRTDRGETALAVLEFMFDGCEPENLSEGGEIAFESFRRTLETSRNNAGRGGRKPKTDCEPIKNRTATDCEPNCNPVKTDCETSSSLSYSSSLSTPPLSPPSGGEGDAKSVFFGKYTALKQGRTKDEGIDYNVLLEEFEKSTMLRGMYSFSKIASMYDAIKRGDFRDKARTVTNPAVDALNAKAEREKWYAERQARAESIAYAYQRTAKSNKRFVELERELAKMNLELAKAEVAGADNLIALREYQEQLREERGRILKKLGIEESQLVPQYACSKCNDSGFMEDGRACDCYKT